MIQILPSSREDLLVAKGTGTLTKEDYEDVLIPAFKKIFQNNPKARFLFQMDEDFQGWDSDALKDYANFGFEHRNHFEKVAGVCGPKWVNWGMKLQSLFSDADVKSFNCDQNSEAMNWINS